MDASEDIGSTLLPRYIKTPHLWIAFVLFVAASCALAFYMPKPRPYLGLCLPMAAGFLMVPYSARFARQRFTEWADNVPKFAGVASSGAPAPGQNAHQWVRSELSFFNGSPRMYAVGFCFAVWTWSSFYLGGYFSGFGVLPVSFVCILTILSAAVAGAGLYVVFCGARLIWRLGDVRYQILVHDHKFGVLSTGRMLGEIFFVLAFICMVYDLSAVLGEPNPSTDFSYRNPPLWMLVVPTAVFIVIAFIYCQIPLHRRMLEFKKTKLNEIETRLDRLDDEKNMSGEQRADIQFHEGRRKEILSLPEWPFGLGNIFGTVGASITSGLPMVLSAIQKAAPNFHF